MIRKVLLSLFCTSLLASAQNRLITLDVVVNDKSDKPVSGLQQQDFTLLDNKQPLKIASFRAVQGTAAEPLEVVLLFDRVNTPFAYYAQMRIEAKKFLTKNNGQLDQPVSMIFLSEAGVDSVPPNRDGNALMAALEKSDTSLRTTRSQGVYGAIDRFETSFRAMMQIAEFEEPKPGRKMLIWIAPGWPILNPSSTGLTAREQQGIFRSVVEASTALRDARIAVYSLDPLGLADAGSGRTTYYKDFLKPVTSVRKVLPGNVALQVLAEQSGGRALSSSNDIATQITRCIADTAAYYVITFDAPTPDGPDEYHAIEVKLGKRGLTAHTRAGYYAEP
jgi:VWFA-related protein